MSVPIAIGTDSWDYSRYDPSCDIIQVWGAVDTAHQHQTCTITLSRNDSYGILATHVINNVGATFNTSFDLNSSEMEDSDGFNRAVQGDYTVTAKLTDGNLASVGISVSIVSVNELRTRWLYGLTTLSSEISLPRQQPRALPVKVTFVSPAFVRDAYNLIYIVGPPATLSFAGGPAKIITPNTGIQDYVLLDEKEADYVQVRVNTFQLPGTNKAENLIIDSAQLTDDDFVRYARLATAYIETRLGFYVEPHLVISERLKSKYPKYEAIKDGATFYDDFNPSSGVFPNISLPLQWLLKVKELTGYYNQNKVLTVPGVWIQTGSRQQGNIELVPTSGQASALVWQSFPFAFSTMQTRLIPSFWQYAVIAGLPDLKGDREVIKECIAKKAGIDLALFSANAYKAGISSESTSRDSVSISRSYTTSAMYSTFAHITLPWQDWLKENLPMIRKKLGGIPVVTVV